MDNLVNIDDYTSPKILYPKKFYSWVIILVLTLFIIVFALFKISFDFYYNNTGFVLDKNLIKVSVPSSKLEYISNNKVININKKNYNYEITKIEEPIVNPMDLSYYQEVLILVKDYNGINNNFADFKIKYDSKKIIKIVKDFILGEGK